ncbi:MAG TPA: serine hydrolase domain-containing protein [Thermoanaerobaculia bacterium]|jgi:CubicO group peptidase (beta-lactamase class C family)
MYKRPFVALLAFLACSLSLVAQANPAIEGGRADVRAIMEAQKAPGMSVAVLVDGKVVWSEGFGLADVEQNVAASAATRYRLGSVSKLFTAAVAARLAERGALDLDAPVSKYAAFPHEVTSRQILGHLSGIRHYGNADPIFAGKTYASLREGLSIFAKDPLLAPPGTAYTYTSYGFNLLGVVIEGASRRTFAEALADEVILPLGVKTIALDDPSTIVPNRAAFYDKRADGTIRNAAPNDSSYKWPSGGLVASAEDVARFADAHVKPGYLYEVMLTQMFTPQKMADGKPTNVGLGWRVNQTEDGTRYWHHGGTITGGRAFVLVLPEQRVSVALLANLLVRYDEKDLLAIARRFVR